MCEYCDGTATIDTKLDFMSVEHGYIEVYIEDSNNYFIINYCPMCGKKLEEEIK